jgi:SPP1 gp7 family putative phage head morphogenesis protein
MPNAGMPRDVGGRRIYMASAEYFATYARHLVQGGAKIVGGCCGTTPDHIGAMCAALRVERAMVRGSGHRTREPEDFTTTESRVPTPDATKANVDLITSIPQKYLAKLEKHVTDSFVSGVRHEDLIQEIYPDLRREMGRRYASAPPAYFEKQQLTPEEIIDRVDEITENRAKLIARDQTAKMNSSFNQVRQTSVGIEKYQWQTAGDERVRESHAEKDGKVFSWDDPPEDTGHPGEDIQCRCVAIPFFDLDEMEEELSNDT